MTRWPAALADWLAGSAASDTATAALRSVPGLPPMLQTLHLLAVIVVVATLVVLLLRVNRLVLRDTVITDFWRGMRWWVWSALLVLPLSMAPLFLARPHRYLHNPVFGIKMAALVTALVLTGWVIRRLQRSGHRRQTGRSREATGCAGEAGNLTRLLAVPAVLAWFAVMLAGRWVAYSDYLFWPS